MKNVLIMLIRLSEIDTKIDELTQEQNHIPQTNKDLQTEIIRLENAIKSLQSEQSRLETFKKDSEEFIRDKKIWLEEREQLVKSIKTNKEYQSALKEITTAKKEIADREYQIQETDSKIDGLKTSVDTTINANLATIEELKTQITQNEEKLGQFDSLISAEQHLRKGVVSEIEKAHLERYEQIRKRISPVLSRVDVRTCSECSTMISPQMLNLIHVSKDLMICPRCKRILYVEALLEK